MESTLQPKRAADYRLVDLPEREAALSGFISKMQKIRYFEPDGNPKGNWLEFKERTLGKAYDSAAKALSMVNGTGRAYVFRCDRHYEVYRRISTAINAAASSAGRSFALPEAAKMAVESIEGLVYDAARSKLRKGPVSSSIMGVVREFVRHMAELTVVNDLDFEGRKEYNNYMEAILEVLERGYGFGGNICPDISNLATNRFYVFCCSGSQQTGLNATQPSLRNECSREEGKGVIDPYDGTYRTPVVLDSVNYLRVYTDDGKGNVCCSGLIQAGKKRVVILREK